MFAWYDAATLQFECYAQRVRADGSEAFPHNGVLGSTNLTRVRVSPAVAFEEASEEVLLFWREQGVGGGRAVRPEARSERRAAVDGRRARGRRARAHQHHPGARAAARRRRLRVLVRRARLRLRPALGVRTSDAAGAVGVGPFDIASTPSSKLRSFVAATSAGAALVAWEDERTDAATSSLRT